MMHTTMGPEVVSQYEGVQSAVAHTFLQDLLREPQGLASHIEL